MGIIIGYIPAKSNGSFLKIGWYLIDDNVYRTEQYIMYHLQLISFRQFMHLISSGFNLMYAFTQIFHIFFYCLCNFIP